jgi:hypothetical protein
MFFIIGYAHIIYSGTAKIVDWHTTVCVRDRPKSIEDVRTDWTRRNQWSHARMRRANSATLSRPRLRTQN